MRDSELGERLVAMGVSPEEVEQADDEGWLVMLALDRAVLPGPRTLTRIDVAQRAGVDPELARRLWRAMGLPDVDDDAAMFGDADVEILQTARSLMSDSEDALLTRARVIAGAMNQIAEVFADQIHDGLETLLEAGATERIQAEVLLDMVDLDLMSRVLDYVQRRMLQAALWRQLGVHPGVHSHEEPRAIGFADLVRFTALSAQLGGEELETLVSRFEAVTHDTVTGNGGRIVKRIGDEVMFTATTPVAAVKIGLDLVREHAVDEDLPDIKVGLAWGPVLDHLGDKFGPTVNRASRIVTIARPGTVVVDDALHDELVADDEGVAELGYRLRPMGRRRIKGIGLERLWTLRRLRPDDGRSPVADVAEVGRSAVAKTLEAIGRKDAAGEDDEGSDA